MSERSCSRMTLLGRSRKFVVGQQKSSLDGNRTSVVDRGCVETPFLLLSARLPVKSIEFNTSSLLIEHPEHKKAPRGFRFLPSDCSGTSRTEPSFPPAADRQRSSPARPGARPHSHRA